MNTILFKKGNRCFPFFILAIGLLIGCTQKSETNSISLYDDTYFLLKENEKENKKSPTVVDSFESILIENKLPQDPLYKYIKHPMYDIYISIKLSKENASDSLKYFTTSNKKGIFYTFKTQKGKKYSLLAVANDSLHNNEEALTYENISKRFIEN